MSRSNNPTTTERFHFPNSPALWHESTGRARSLGCQQCAHLLECGGLNVAAGIYDCLTYCRCVDPAHCDNVCPKNPGHLVARSMEVQGFMLDNVPAAPRLPVPVLPPVVPMLYHSAARARAPSVPTVALSLYEVIGRGDGLRPLLTRRALLDRFKLADDVHIVLTGTDNDRPLERWWKIADSAALLQAIREFGISLVTTPNFSLFDDVPRHDNLYNMKRIARVWSEIQNAGVPCALHLNARTDRDWERWTVFLKAHPEISCVAFEFGTGAGSKSRIPWYVTQLKRLADEASRPLQLILRGGLGEIDALTRMFSSVTLIDTSAFIRAQKRRRMAIEDGKLRWTRSPTLMGEPIDDLLDANIAAVQQYVSRFAQSSESQTTVASVPSVAA